GAEREAIGIAHGAHTGVTHPPIGNWVSYGPMGERTFNCRPMVAIDEGVTQDLDEPRLKVCTGLKLLAGANGLDGRVLNQVLGFCFVAAKPSRKCQQRWHMAYDVCLKLTNLQFDGFAGGI